MRICLDKSISMLRHRRTHDSMQDNRISIMNYDTPRIRFGCVAIESNQPRSNRQKHNNLLLSLSTNGARGPRAAQVLLLPWLPLQKLLSARRAFCSVFRHIFGRSPCLCLSALVLRSQPCAPTLTDACQNPRSLE